MALFLPTKNYSTREKKSGLQGNFEAGTNYFCAVNNAAKAHFFNPDILVVILMKVNCLISKASCLYYIRR